MTQHDDHIRVRHMLEYAYKAIKFNVDRSRDDLDANEMLALSTIHCIEVIGEAANTISDNLKDRYPEMPWSLASGTRNRLVHGYDNINLDIIWTIVKQDLPTLVTQLELILEKENKSGR